MHNPKHTTFIREVFHFVRCVLFSQSDGCFVQLWKPIPFTAYWIMAITRKWRNFLCVPCISHTNDDNGDKKKNTKKKWKKNEPKKYHNILLIQLSVIKYPNDIYANDLITWSQVVYLQNVIFSKDIDKLRHIFLSLSLLIFLKFVSLVKWIFSFAFANRAHEKFVLYEQKFDIVSLKNYNFCNTNRPVCYIISTDWVFLIMLEYQQLKFWYTKRKKIRHYYEERLGACSFLLLLLLFCLWIGVLSISISISSWRVCNWDSEDYI